MTGPISTKTSKENTAERAKGGSQEQPHQPAFAGPQADILALQRAAGNRAVSRLLQSNGNGPPPVQAKLMINQPGDKYEQEAERVTKAVMRTPGPTAQPSIDPVREERPQTKQFSGQVSHLIQRQSGDEPITTRAPEQEAPEENEEVPVDTTLEPMLVRKVAEQEEETPIAAKRRAGATPKAGSLEADLADSRGTGSTIPGEVRAWFEHKFGSRFDDVRIHTDGKAMQMAEQLNAQAFTQGRDVYFGAGQYAPYSSSGLQLIAHELTHVIQQRQTKISGSFVQRRNGKAQKKEVIFRFKVPVNKKVDRDEFLIIMLMHVFSISRAEAEQHKAAAGWNWEGWSPITAQDVRRKFIWVRIPRSHYRRTIDELKGRGQKSREVGGRIKGATAREEQFKKLSKREQTSINREADKQFRQKTGKKRAKDQAEADLWTEIRDETLEDREKLQQLPQNIKSLLLGGRKFFKPEDYKQLLRIAKKLEPLTPEDIELYRLLANEITKDLDVFEKSIDEFIKIREQFREQLEKAAKARKLLKMRQTEEPTLEEKLAKAWEGVDLAKLEKLDPSHREALARKIAAKQRNIQLEHMAENPGETIANMAKGIVRVDQVAEGIYEDVKEAASGDKNAFARWAGGVGATGKLAGWLAGVAGIAYIALLFVPGVNVTLLLGTALVAGVSAVALSAVESELRIKAAAEAKNPEEFKTQTEKAAAAQANAIIGGAMMVLGLALKIVARTPLPGRLQNVGNALKLGRQALLKKVGINPVRSQVLGELTRAGRGLRKALSKEIKRLTRIAKRVKAMTGDELVAKIAAGDKVLQEVTGLTAKQAKELQAIAKTSAGKGMPEHLRQNLLKALEDAPAQAEKQVNGFLKELDNAISEIRSAKTPDQLKGAIDSAEKHLSPEGMAEKIVTEQQAFVKERLKEAKAEKPSRPDGETPSSKVEEAETKVRPTEAGEGTQVKLPKIDPSTVPESWKVARPPSSGGQPVKVYRGFARNAKRHSTQVVKEGEIGGVLSRDPAAAHDAVFNHVGRDPVLSGPQQGGVVEITIPASLWDELVNTFNIAERGQYPGFSRKLNTTEIRVNSSEAARAINNSKKQILRPDKKYDFRSAQ